MESAIIGCKTLEDELKCAMESLDCMYPVYWIESGLHDTPKKLNKVVQEYLNNLTYDRLFLAMGFCGNALQGLKTGVSEIIVPRVDDCVSLLLGSVANRLRINKEMPTYYMTKGWLAGERNIWVEYKYTTEKYGEDTGKEIFDMIFHEYKRLGVLDTGCYDVNEILDETKLIASTLGLEHTVITATEDYLTELLSGPWHENRFMMIPPGSEIMLTDLYLKEGNGT